MSRPTAQITAARTDRSLVPSSPVQNKLTADPRLLFWRRMIETAVADATRTRFGIPTDTAILQRWWIEDHRPKREDKRAWQLSFECCCGWLNLDADAERTRLVALIEAELAAAYARFARNTVRLRRAAVLMCAGVATSVGKQYELPLVSCADYEDVAGIVHKDPPMRLARKPHKPRRRVETQRIDDVGMMTAKAA